MCKERVDERVVGIAGRRVDDEACRFVEDDYLLILEADVERLRLRQWGVGLWNGHRDGKALTRFDLERGVSYRCTLARHLALFDKPLQPRARERAKPLGEQPVKPLAGSIGRGGDGEQAGAGPGVPILGHNPLKVIRRMRALKIMVIVLGVLLVLGTAALVAAVVERVEGRRPSALRQAESLHVPLPAGARILTVELVGDRLMVRAALAQGGETILLIDARTGRLIATIGASNKP